MFGCETSLCDIILSALLADVTVTHTAEKRNSSSSEESRGICANRVPRQHCDKSFHGNSDFFFSCIKLKRKSTHKPIMRNGKK
jgi:hypothetical protein